MGAAMDGAVGAGDWPGGGPRVGAAIGGGWLAGASREGRRGPWSQGCGAMCLTLIRLCGLFAACTAWTAWADD